MQGDSVVVRDSESSSHPGFELSRFNCILEIAKIGCPEDIDTETTKTSHGYFF